MNEDVDHLFIRCDFFWQNLVLDFKLDWFCYGSFGIPFRSYAFWLFKRFI